MENGTRTPGPRSYDEDGLRIVYGPKDGHGEGPMICDVTDTYEGLEGDCATADANARLIAAAPDLLAQAKAIIARASRHDRGHEGGDLLAILSGTHAAIAKAEGE